MKFPQNCMSKMYLREINFEKRMSLYCHVYIKVNGIAFKKFISLGETMILRYIYYRKIVYNINNNETNRTLSYKKKLQH